MNATIVRLSAQALLGRRRGLVLVVVPAILVVLAIVIRTLTEPGTAYPQIVSGLGLDLVVPLTALLAATAVLGPEVDDGSVVYLLAKPVNRFAVALSKYVVATAATVATGALAVLAAGLVIDSGDPTRTVAMLGGAVLGAAAYSALFLALCSATRHAVVVGLLFVLLWEGVLGGLLQGIRWLSVGAWGRQVAALADANALGPAAQVGLAYALVAAALVTVAGVLYAGWRLSTFTLTGET